MRWNPILNAVAASAYIVLIGTIMHVISTYRANTPDTFLDPIGAISLLVFSVAVMAFLFFYRPLVLLVENDKRGALAYFIKTLAIFGVITLAVVALILLQ